MKFTLILTSFLGIAAAMELSRLESRATRTLTRSPRPRLMTDLETRTVFRTSVGAPTEKRSKDALTMVPGLQRRAGNIETRDFYECTNPDLRPDVADCNAIVSEVSKDDNAVILAENACLVYTFGTCQGFFCSLCDTMETTTQFIGTQLDNVVALCVENGQPGTIVGEEAPQWQAGFTYAGEGLPSFDVC